MVIAWPSGRVWEALGEALDSQHSFLDPNLEQNLQGAARLLRLDRHPGSLELMVALLPLSSTCSERVTGLFPWPSLSALNQGLCFTEEKTEV